MIRKEMKYIKLIAEEGKILQNKADKYICSKEINLGCNDSEKNWQEIDEKNVPIRKEEPIN